jgi:hypothetical protein
LAVFLAFPISPLGKGGDGGDDGDKSIISIFVFESMGGLAFLFFF